MHDLRAAIVLVTMALTGGTAIAQGQGGIGSSDAYDRAYERGTPHASRAELDAVADLCVRAARDKAESESGGSADILEIGQPRRASRGGWDVEGRLKQRLSDRGNQIETLRFSCAIANGRTLRVTVTR